MRYRIWGNTVSGVVAQSVSCVMSFLVERLGGKRGGMSFASHAGFGVRVSHSITTGLLAFRTTGSLSSYVYGIG